MYFEVELQGKKYHIDVVETNDFWKIALQEENQSWLFYDIPKSDFQQAERTISFLFKGKSYLIDVIKDDTEYNIYTQGSYRTLKIYNDEMILHESLKKGSLLGKELELTTKIPGTILEILVKEGESVSRDQPLLIMEAMKMENELRAECDVKIKEILVKEGQSVDSGSLLMRFE